MKPTQTKRFLTQLIQKVENFNTDEQTAFPNIRKTIWLKCEKWPIWFLLLIKWTKMFFHKKKKIRNNHNTRQLLRNTNLTLFFVSSPEQNSKKFTEKSIENSFPWLFLHGSRIWKPRFPLLQTSEIQFEFRLEINKRISTDAFHNSNRSKTSRIPLDNWRKHRNFPASGYVKTSRSKAKNHPLPNLPWYVIVQYDNNVFNCITIAELFAIKSVFWLKLFVIDPWNNKLNIHQRV